MSIFYPSFLHTQRCQTPYKSREKDLMVFLSSYSKIASSTKTSEWNASQSVSQSNSRSIFYSSSIRFILHFNNSFVRLFVCSSVRLFVCSFARLFVYLFARIFVVGKLYYRRMFFVPVRLVQETFRGCTREYLTIYQNLNDDKNRGNTYYKTLFRGRVSVPYTP